MFASSTISSVEISIFHTVFNVSNTLLLFPFAGFLVKASSLLVRDGKSGKAETERSQMQRHLDERILETPSFAIENATQEVINMGKAALENFDIAAAALLDNSRAEEMCIRDSPRSPRSVPLPLPQTCLLRLCLLYTSRCV